LVSFPSSFLLSPVFTLLPPFPILLLSHPSPLSRFHSPSPLFQPFLSPILLLSNPLLHLPCRPPPVYVEPRVKTTLLLMSQ
jgi:hypothetical protein